MAYFTHLKNLYNKTLKTLKNDFDFRHQSGNWIKSLIVVVISLKKKVLSLYLCWIKGSRKEKEKNKREN